MDQEQVIRDLEEARAATSDRRSFERYQILLLWLKGYSVPSIREISGRSTSTIYNYINAYQARGIAGLERGKSTGKPSKLSLEQKIILKDTIAYQTPAEVGFSARYNWTLQLVVLFIEQKWGPTYTKKGASKLLHSLGLSYTRPTYTMQKADPQQQRKFKEETFPALKKS